MKSVQKFIEENNTRKLDSNQGNGNVNDKPSEEQPKVSFSFLFPDSLIHTCMLAPQNLFI